MTDRIRAIEGLALVAALTAVFDGVHPLGDQFVQNSHDASTKGMHGSHLVYVNDGSPVEENPWRHGTTANGAENASSPASTSCAAVTWPAPASRAPRATATR
jgi:hypothetical protein